MNDTPTVQLRRVDPTPMWPTVDPDEAAADARRVLTHHETPPIRILQRVLDGLRRYCIRRCGLCDIDPVARPGWPVDTIDGRFCPGCIADCLADTARDHWCPIDTLGSHR